MWGVGGRGTTQKINDQISFDNFQRYVQEAETRRGEEEDNVHIYESLENVVAEKCNG